MQHYVNPVQPWPINISTNVMLQLLLKRVDKLERDLTSTQQEVLSLREEVQLSREDNDRLRSRLSVHETRLDEVSRQQSPCAETMGEYSVPKTEPTDSGFMQGPQAPNVTQKTSTSNEPREDGSGDHSLTPRPTKKKRSRRRKGLKRPREGTYKAMILDALKDMSDEACTSKEIISRIKKDLGAKANESSIRVNLSHLVKKNKIRKAVPTRSKKIRGQGRVIHPHYTLITAHAATTQEPSTPKTPNACKTEAKDARGTANKQELSPLCKSKPVTEDRKLRLSEGILAMTPHPKPVEHPGQTPRPPCIPHFPSLSKDSVESSLRKIKPRNQFASRAALDDHSLPATTIHQPITLCAQSISEDFLANRAFA